MARYLVTGGAGFIGSNLCAALLDRGDDVAVVDNLDPYYSVERKQRNLTEFSPRRGCQVHIGSICDRSFLRPVFDDFHPDVVVHLAARAGVRPSLSDPVGYMDVNVSGTAQVLQCAAQHEARVVFSSSSSVYGAGAKTPFTEDQPALRPLSPYAASKIAGEVCARAFWEAHGLPVVCLRLFSVYGPRQRPDLAISKFADRMLAGLPIPVFGDGASERDYTNVGDVVRAVLLAAQADIGYDIFNIGTGAAVRLSSLISMLSDALGSPALIDRLPDQPGDMPRTCADNSRARQVLGWEPLVALPEGLSEFAEWFRAPEPISVAA